MKCNGFTAILVTELARVWGGKAKKKTKTYELQTPDTRGPTGGSRTTGQAPGKKYDNIITRIANNQTDGKPHTAEEQEAQDGQNFGKALHAFGWPPRLK